MIIVYPKRYNNSNPNSVPGKVLRASLTGVEGAVPGPVIDFSGETAFENFFLNWKAPGSEYQAGSTNLLKQKPNDIDYYEVWASSSNVLYTGDNQGNLSAWTQEENTGYRQIGGVMHSTGNIPEESPDPALKISGAENIFNVSANSPSVESVYPGKTNDTKNFWIRAVDFGGNKSPFTGSLINDNDNISGLSLTPGLASATDVADFEIGMTEKFGNSIALIPPNPFSDDVGSISWIDHVLYFRGTGYFINGSNTNSGYVWWDVSENPNQSNYEYQGLRDIKYSGDYKVSDAHPQGGYNANNEYISGLDGFQDIDFIIARNNNGTASLAFSSFPNALIGTANIADASIVDAKINNLSAGKITAGEINTADIQISTFGSQAGVIRSVDFTGIDYSDPSNSGFYISGDGTFAFQGGGSSLSLEDDTLTLRGKLRQTNGFDYDFVDLNVSPSHFNYIETRGYEAGTAGVDTFIPDDNSPTSIEIISTFRNSSVTQTGVRFRMDVLSGDNRRPVFGYDEFTGNGQYDISGFEYNPSNFIDDSNNSSTKIASGSFALGKRLDSTAQLNGFDYLIDEAFPGSGLADSVVLYVSGLYSTYERSFTITRINDGRFGDPGVTPTYRGPWNNTNIYNFTPSTIDNPGRGDIVSFGQNHPDRTPADSINSNYFIANQDNFSGQKPIVGGSVNSSYWSEFGTELENVATNILLTNEAFITEKLTMGANNGATDNPHSGIIVSQGFTGGLLNVNSLPYQELNGSTENYNTPGFLLAQKNDGVVFDVGGTGADGIDSYIRFDSQSGKLEIAASFINNTINNTGLFYDGTFDNFTSADNLTAFIGGGYNNNLINSLSGDKYFENIGSAIVGGAWNSMNGRFSTIAGGYSGLCSDNFSFIGAGYGNSMPLEEPGDHQGANFIGGGIENVISGGASQSILNGIENKINQTEGRYLNNESVRFDEDQGWLSSRFLGDQSTAQFIPNRTGIVSGVIFPAVENSDWGENASGYWQNELDVGHLEGINKGGWVEYSGLGWFYINEPNISDIYSDNNWNSLGWVGWVFSHTYRTWMYWIGNDDDKHHLLALAQPTSTGWFEMRMNRSNPSAPYVEATLQDSGNWDSWGNPIA